ncbi:MAG: isopentenyl-diphosphate Delta-isomerase [Rikenellaceae bacterium]|nr:isopentenyl-diphosphate Delta-isomerase [Rikenellaceae bacterium]
MVILVDDHNSPKGEIEKMEAHRKGLLHRAFSVLIFNENGELLLQRRALDKYHSGGLWTNTCCSHPLPGESTETAAMRRLSEEMGMVADLEFSGSFIYRAALDNGLIEHEYDHIYTGVSDDLPNPDPAEVAEFMYLGIPELLISISEEPWRYTEWFKIICAGYLEMQLEPASIYR